MQYFEKNIIFLYAVRLALVLVQGVSEIWLFIFRSTATHSWSSDLCRSSNMSSRTNVQSYSQLLLVDHYFLATDCSSVMAGEYKKRAQFFFEDTLCIQKCAVPTKLLDFLYHTLPHTHMYVLILSIYLSIYLSSSYLSIFLFMFSMYLSIYLFLKIYLSIPN